MIAERVEDAGREWLGVDFAKFDLETPAIAFHVEATFRPEAGLGAVVAPKDIREIREPLAAKPGV